MPSTKGVPVSAGGGAGLSLRNGKYRGGCVNPSSLLPRTPPNGLGVPPNLLEVCDGSFH